MDMIRYFKLQNAGGFVAHIDVSYQPYGKKDWETWKPSGYADICLGAERTQDLKELGIVDGTPVRLIAFVALGKDNHAKEEYIFSSSSGKTASYRISGTTLSNKLRLLGCS